MIGALHELKLGLRRLSRSLGFLLSSVACLALGIGVNATMLTFLDIVLFRPPAHVRDAGTVVRLSYRQSGGEFPQAVFCYPAYTDLARGSNAFSAMAAHAYDLSGSSLGSGAAAQRVRLDLVTPGFFPLLGVHPLRGRLFSEAEGDPERPGFVALVSWEFWQRAFGGAEILGRRLPIGQQSYTVVGVLPPRFTGVDLEPVDVWLPAGAFRFLGGSPGWSHDRGLFQWSVVGRLRPGVSVRQARLQATLTYQRASAALGDRHGAEHLTGAGSAGLEPGRRQGRPPRGLERRRRHGGVLDGVRQRRRPVAPAFPGPALGAGGASRSGRQPYEPRAPPAGREPVAGAAGRRGRSGRSLGEQGSARRFLSPWRIP
jgi:MacB-like protein